MPLNIMTTNISGYVLIISTLSSDYCYPNSTVTSLAICDKLWGLSLDDVIQMIVMREVQKIMNMINHWLISRTS